jgi:hypothetical protein
MKYAWILIVMVGIAGMYLGIQRYQMPHTEAFGEYPCFLCSSMEPDFRIIAFSSLNCSSCDQAVSRIERFCRLTGVLYEGVYYDNSGETPQKLSELGLQKTTDFLVVILKNETVIKTGTATETVESFLAQTLKEASQL